MRFKKNDRVKYNSSAYQQVLTVENPTPDADGRILCRADGKYHVLKQEGLRKVASLDFQPLRNADINMGALVNDISPQLTVYENYRIFKRKRKDTGPQKWKIIYNEERQRYYFTTFTKQNQSLLPMTFNLKENARDFMWILNQNKEASNDEEVYHPETHTDENHHQDDEDEGE